MLHGGNPRGIIRLCPHEFPGTSSHFGESCACKASPSHATHVDYNEINDEEQSCRIPGKHCMIRLERYPESGYPLPTKGHLTRPMDPLSVSDPETRSLRHGDRQKKFKSLRKETDGRSWYGVRERGAAL